MSLSYSSHSVGFLSKFITLIERIQAIGGSAGFGTKFDRQEKKMLSYPRIEPNTFCSLCCAGKYPICHNFQIQSLNLCLVVKMTKFLFSHRKPDANWNIIKIGHNTVGYWWVMMMSRIILACQRIQYVLVYLLVWKAHTRGQNSLGLHYTSEILLILSKSQSANRCNEYFYAPLWKTRGILLCTCRSVCRSVGRYPLTLCNW